MTYLLGRISVLLSPRSRPWLLLQGTEETVLSKACGCVLGDMHASVRQVCPCETGFSLRWKLMREETPALPLQISSSPDDVQVKRLLNVSWSHSRSALPAWLSRTVGQLIYMSLIFSGAKIINVCGDAWLVLFQWGVWSSQELLPHKVLHLVL